MNKKEKQLNSEKIYEGRILTLRKDEVLCPNGEKSIREVIDHHGGVAILIKIGDKFIVERQFRYAFGQEIYELPAGKLEKDEDPLEGAKRECLEETGYRPLEMIHLGDMYPTCGYSTEVDYIYYCPKSVKEERHLDSDEVIDLLYLSLEEIEELVRQNKINDAKLLCALSLYHAKIATK